VHACLTAALDADMVDWIQEHADD